jgi:hypothetical protein
VHHQITMVIRLRPSTPAALNMRYPRDLRENPQAIASGATLIAKAQTPQRLTRPPLRNEGRSAWCSHSPTVANVGRANARNTSLTSLGDNRLRLSIHQFSTRTKVEDKYSTNTPGGI